MSKFYRSALVLVALVMLSGCLKPEADSTVLLMGDSIAQEMSDDMSFQLLWRDNAPLYVVNAMGGFTTSESTSAEYWVSRMNQIQADTIFISLGTNDAAAGAELADFEYAVHLILDAAGDSQVYWLLPSALTTRIEGMMEVRAALIMIVALYPNAETVEVLEGAHDTDNIHLSSHGEAETAKQFVRLLGLSASEW
jgi:lysophospholipase L1-like esterase